MQEELPELALQPSSTSQSPSIRLQIKNSPSHSTPEGSLISQPRTPPPKSIIQPPLKSRDHSHQQYNRNDNEACSPTIRNQSHHDLATYEMAIQNCYYYSIQNNGQNLRTTEQQQKQIIQQQ
jgi:hypothetical protein